MQHMWFTYKFHHCYFQKLEMVSSLLTVKILPTVKCVMMKIYNVIRGRFQKSLNERKYVKNMQTAPSTFQYASMFNF